MVDLDNYLFGKTFIEKGKKKMKITIIGSTNVSKHKMDECRKYWENFGHEVYCPCESVYKNSPLIEKQSAWINFIKEADLIVAIPKKAKLLPDVDLTLFLHEFGDSTSYEMATAMSLNKQIIIWSLGV